VITPFPSFFLLDRGKERKKGREGLWLGGKGKSGRDWPRRKKGKKKREASRILIHSLYLIIRNEKKKKNERRNEN